MLNIGDRPSDISSHKIEDPLGRRGKESDGKISVEQEDRHTDTCIEIREVAIEARQFVIPVDHLIVDGRQLLVRRFKLFFGSLEFLVDALHLLVCRLRFLVRDLELLICSLILFLQRLDVVVSLGKFLLQADKFAAF